jgi:hypothetical protein
MLIQKGKNMKKIFLSSVLGVALVGSQVSSARAGGWPIAAGVLGGLAVGTAVGATVVAANQPVYYYPPQTVYGSGVVTPAPSYAPTYQIQNAPTVPNAPAMNQTPAYAPQVVYAQPAPTVVYSTPAYYPAPVIGVGLGWPFWGWGGYYHGGYYGRGYYGHGYRR